MAGNMIAMIVGFVFLVLGAYLTYRWEMHFWVMFKGCIGITLMFVGLLGIIIGYSEYKATKEFQAATTGGSEPPTPPSPPTPEPAASTEEKP